MFRGNSLSVISVQSVVVAAIRIYSCSFVVKILTVHRNRSRSAHLVFVYSRSRLGRLHIYELLLDLFHAVQGKFLKIFPTITTSAVGRIRPVAKMDRIHTNDGRRSRTTDDTDSGAHALA